MHAHQGCRHGPDPAVISSFSGFDAAATLGLKRNSKAIELLLESALERNSREQIGEARKDICAPAPPCSTPKAGDNGCVAAEALQKRVSPATASCKIWFWQLVKRQRDDIDQQALSIQSANSTGRTAPDVFACLLGTRAHRTDPVARTYLTQPPSGRKSVTALLRWT